MNDRQLTLLVTGGCGFIGSNFCRLILHRHADWRIRVLDKLGYAGNLQNLADLEGNTRFSFVRGDACDPVCVGELMEGADVVVNFAAETHVDRSIAGPAEVWRNNVLLAEAMLSAAREHSVPQFVQISTDEVYGSLGPAGSFTESSPLRPNNPYAASKAAADLLAQAFHHTYGMPVVIVRGGNNYGPYQFPEKLIALLITNALEDKPLPIYGDGLYVRDWVYVEDFCRAVEMIVEKGANGGVFNVGCESSVTNLDIARMILDLVGKPSSLVVHVKDRPGHDRRYAMDSGRIRSEIGWRPAVALRDGLARTVEWYRANAAWWQRIKNGEYIEYYRRHYVEERGLRDDIGGNVT